MTDSEQFVESEIGKGMAARQKGHKYRPTCLMCQKNIAIPHKYIPWRP